ncbi:MAG: serine hydrolase [Ignavibacterium sp.]|jgi:CubicO group peptidase (beta-lactamase class C family)|nr:serine hydrolase [Ignavibacterium sp.]
MKNILILLIIVSGFFESLKSQDIYFPPLTGNNWEIISPDSLGWCTDKIDSLYYFLDQKNTKAFIVLKDGKIVLEHYFDSFVEDSIWYWASAGKTLTAFLTGIAQEEGYLSLSDSTSKYLGTGWTSCPPEKEKLITIWNQLTMTSGLRDYVADPYCTEPECLIYQSDAGTRWAYHNAPYTLLDEVVKNATGQNFNIYFNNKIRSRIGMNGIWLPSGYNDVYYSNARSMARFGILIQNKGVWETDTLLHDADYFNAMVNTSQNLNESYGYLWWLAGKETYMLPRTQFVFPGTWAPDAPSDMIAALGKNGQTLNVVPSMGLVIVRMGEAPDSSTEVSVTLCNEIWQKLNPVICNANSVDEFTDSPTEFRLEQNYPNPFNPSTKISWESPVSGWQTLKVYDILGNEVATLIDEFRAAGNYETEFNPASSIKNLASGIYFYQLKTENLVQTKKMILLR